MTTQSILDPATAAPADGYQRRRQETRRLLLQAACALFIEHGVEHVSIDAITKNAGVAKGSFYNHFDSREVLFEELVESTLQVLLEKYKAFSPRIEDPLELALTRTWFAFYTLLSDPQDCRLMLQAGSANAVGAIDRVLRVAVSAELMEGVAQGALSHLRPELVYAAYFGVVTNSIVHLLGQGDDMDPVSGADAVTQLCFAVMGLPHHPPQHYLDENTG